MSSFCLEIIIFFFCLLTLSYLRKLTACSNSKREKLWTNERQRKSRVEAVFRYNKRVQLWRSDRDNEQLRWIQELHSSHFRFTKAVPVWARRLRQTPRRSFWQPRPFPSRWLPSCSPHRPAKIAGSPRCTPSSRSPRTPAGRLHRGERKHFETWTVSFQTLMRGSMTQLLRTWLVQHNPLFSFFPISECRACEMF